MASSSEIRKRVLVIGGGVAGLTAATTLIKSGYFEVTLLEADNRIGGRVQTLKFGNNFIENGAQWVHGNENNSVFLKSRPLGLLDSSGNNLKFDVDSVFVNENGTALPKDKHNVLRKVLSKLYHGPQDSNSLPDEPLGNWAEKVFWEDDFAQELSEDDKLVAAKVFDWQHRFQTGYDGSDSWHLPSCKGQQEYWECSGNPLNAWKHPASYSSLLNLILYDKPSFAPQFMPEIPEWIQLEKEATKIDFSSEKEIIVECKDGSIYHADHVICTVSLGVLKERHLTLFSPSLPEVKINAIKFLAIGTVDKLHFEFSHKWWPDDIIGFNLLWNLHDSSIYSTDISEDVLTSEVDGLPLWCRGILGFYVVASHPTALNSWITGPTARLMEKLEESTVKTTFMKVLRKFLGSMYEDIPEPENFLRSAWSANPFTRGSYSFRSVESEHHNVWATDISAPIIKNEIPVLCFAGEASHPHFYSTVHGAHDSGLREATRLINFVQGSNVTLPPMLPFKDEDFKDEENLNSEQ